jgi:hypothetical protein
MGSRSRWGFVLVLVLVLDTSSYFACLFSFFDYEDENDDEDDVKKPAPRNAQLATRIMSQFRVGLLCFALNPLNEPVAIYGS